MKWQQWPFRGIIFGAATAVCLSVAACGYVPVLAIEFFAIDNPVLLCYYERQIMIRGMLMSVAQ